MVLVSQPARKVPALLRTQTGQTGTDAYVYEATAIANALRELNARTARLTAAMIEELPAETTVKWSIASDRYPNAYMDHSNVHGVLGMWAHASDAANIAELARCIANPDRIFNHQS